MAVDNRRFIVTLDNTIGYGNTSGNLKIMNNILKTLRDRGFNVESGGIGPSRWTNAVRKHWNASNTVILGFVNGSDAGVFEECTNNYGYNANKTKSNPDDYAKHYKNRKGEILRGGKDTRFHGKYGFMHNVDTDGYDGVKAHGNKGVDRNNQLVLCFFYNAADFYHPGAKYYDFLVRAHDDNYSGSFKGMSHPRKWLEDYDIGIVFNGGNNDYNGIATAKMAADMFDDSVTPSPSPSPTPVIQPDDSNPENTNKTLTKKVMQQTYEVPYYQRILTTRTNHMGAFKFKEPSDMKYKGQYLVNINFAGDTRYEPCNKTVRIQKFSGEIAHDTLLETITTETYSDGTSTVTNHDGSVPKNTKHTKTVTTTYTYEGGVLKDETVKTTHNWNVIVKSEDMPNSIDDTTPTPHEDNNITPTPTNKASPFSNRIALLSGGIPNVQAMSHGGKNFVMVDTNRTYTLNLSNFQEVYYRDSKILQLHDYYNSKYTAFQSQDSDTFNVISRERWNPIEQSVHAWLVVHNGQNWPTTITIDFPNHRTQINGTWVAWTGETRLHWYVIDHQNDTGEDTGTCGPTSASMCTQYLHNYLSEKKITRGYSPSPESMIGACKNSGRITGSRIGINSVFDNVQKRRPCFFHLPNHYTALLDYNPNAGKYLVGNPANCYGGVCSGWKLRSTVRNNNGGSGANAVILNNWTLSEEERQRVDCFFDSMGGKWNSPTNLESMPIYWESTSKVWKWVS